MERGLEPDRRHLFCDPSRAAARTTHDLDASRNHGSAAGRASDSPGSQRIEQHAVEPSAGSWESRARTSHRGWGQRPGMTHSPDPNEVAIIAGLAVEPGYSIGYGLLKLAKAHEKIADAIVALTEAMNDLAENK
jgi:hypothetical protein